MSATRSPCMHAVLSAIMSEYEYLADVCMCDGLCTRECTKTILSVALALLKHCTFRGMPPNLNSTNDRLLSSRVLTNARTIISDAYEYRAGILGAIVFCQVESIRRPPALTRNPTTDQFFLCNRQSRSDRRHRT